MNSRGDLANDPQHSLNSAKYLVNDLYHSLKHRYHATNYRGNSTNEPPDSIDYIYHSAKDYQDSLNDCNSSSHYCFHSLNDWRKTDWKEDFIAGYEGVIGAGFRMKAYSMLWKEGNVYEMGKITTFQPGVNIFYLLLS